MQKLMKNWKGVAVCGLRLFLAGIFIYAGWVKLLDPALFAIQLRNYDLLSDPWVAVVAVFLPCLEVLVGLAIATRRLEAGALWWVIVMLIVFLGALLSAWARGLNIDCGCFGEAIDRRSLTMAIAMDVALLAMAARLLCHAKSEREVSTLPGY